MHILVFELQNLEMGYPELVYINLSITFQTPKVHCLKEWTQKQPLNDVTDSKSKTDGVTKNHNPPEHIVFEVPNTNGPKPICWSMA